LEIFNNEASASLKQRSHVQLLAPNSWYYYLPTKNSSLITFLLVWRFLLMRYLKVFIKGVLIYKCKGEFYNEVPLTRTEDIILDYYGSQW
jgi:hypothetical protein